MRPQFRGHGVDGKMLGIVGFGSVGSDLAQLAQGVGFTVVGNNRSGQSLRASELGVEMMPLDDLLQHADYIVLTASLNEENRGMIDARRLRMLRPSAYLVNVARGGLIDQAALASALRNRWFAGAALDVFEEEPPRPDDALLTMENVILTPHSRPWTEEFTRDVSASALGAIIDVAAGVRPPHVLNPDVFATAAWTLAPGTEGCRVQ
jgi:phosphoglycerate dehydrogenase-like enzyme